MNLHHYLLLIYSLFIFNYNIYSINYFNNIKAFNAVKSNNSQKLSKQLNKGAEVDYIYNKSSKKTLLMLASEKGNSAIVNTLLGTQANYRLLDNKNKSALTYGAISGDTETVKILLQKCDNSILDHQDSYLRTALHWALYKENFSAAKLIIEKKPDLSLMDTNENFAIFIAIAHNQNDIVTSILNADYNIDLQQTLSYKVRYTEWSDRAGRYVEKEQNKKTSAYSALMYASMMESDDSKIVESLVERGANMDLQDRFGMTALMHASQTCQLNKVKY